MVVVTHDRWFLDAATTRTWELADGRLHSYEGGYAAYVLARAERARIADATRAAAAQPAAQGTGVAAARAARQDQQAPVPYRRGERTDRRRAAGRNGVELVRLATARLGKTVIDVWTCR